MKPQIQAALDAETVFLCQTGELKRIYEVWPDFQHRSEALHRLIIPRFQARFAAIDKQVEVNLATHCHATIVSIALQVQRPTLPEPCADAVIPVRLFWDGDAVVPNGGGYPAPKPVKKPAPRRAKG